MVEELNYNDRLKELFYNPKTMGSAEKLYKILIKEGYTMRLKDVKAWFKLQESNQILQLEKTKIIYPPITSNVSAYQADLMFLDKFERHNSGFHIVFCFIEITSRKAFCYPLKLKNENVINETYEKFLKEINYDIKTINTDSGSEFISKSFASINEKYNIEHYVAQVNDHTKQGKVERFNRTLRGKITAYMKANKTLNWVNALDDLVDNYNNTVHSSIGIEPNNVNEKIKNKIRRRVQKRRKMALEFVHTFKIGDKVRIKKKKSTFSKGTDYYTKSVYEVIGIDKMAIVIRKGNGVEKRVKAYNLKIIEDVEIAPEKPEIIHHDVKENKKVNRYVRKQKKLQPSKENVNNVGEFIIPEKLKPIRETRAKKQYPVIGSRVQVKFNNIWYPGTVRVVTENGYKINFDDGKNNEGNYKKEEVKLIL